MKITGKSFLFLIILILFSSLSFAEFGWIFSPESPPPHFSNGTSGSANLTCATCSGDNLTINGNVTADYFFGDGSHLTGITVATGNPFNQSLNTTDNVLFGSMNSSGNVWVAGNVSPLITLIYDLGSGANRWRHLFVQNISAENIDTLYNISADYFIGSGAYLTDLNISGDLTGYALNVSFLFGHDGVGGMDLRGDPWYLSGTDLEIAENLDVDNDVNIDGELTVDGDICNSTDCYTINDFLLDTDTDTHVKGDDVYLYNDSDTMYFNESKMNETNDIRFVNVAGDNMTGNLNITGWVNATYYYGDGSLLTGISATGSGKKGDDNYLYNDSDTMYFNDTLMNITNDNRYVKINDNITLLDNGWIGISLFSEHIKFNEGDNITIAAELQINGDTLIKNFLKVEDNATITGTLRSKYVNTTELNVTGGYVYLGTTESQKAIYFYEDGDPQGEFFSWSDAGDTFSLTDDLEILGYARVTEDIFTTGAGDDIWLGTINQPDALFQGYANGNLTVEKIQLGSTLNCTGYQCKIYQNFQKSILSNLAGTVLSSNLTATGDKSIRNIESIGYLNNPAGTITYDGFGGYVTPLGTRYKQGSKSTGLRYGNFIIFDGRNNGNSNLSVFGIDVIGSFNTFSKMNFSKSVGLQTQGVGINIFSIQDVNEIYGIYIKRSEGVGKFENETSLFIEKPTSATKNYQVWLEGEGAGSGIYFNNPNTHIRSNTPSKISINASAIGINSLIPLYPFEVNGNFFGTKLTAYFQYNISATGYIDRTSVFDNESYEWDYIKDRSAYTNSTHINHSAFYGYVNWTVPDFDKPVIILQNETQCFKNYSCSNTTPMSNIGDFKKYCIEFEYCHNNTINVTTYPYNKTEEGVNLGDEINVLRQALYDQHDGVDVIQSVNGTEPPLVMVTHDISAEDVLFRTTVYNKAEGSALDKLKDSSKMLDDRGNINHTALIGAKKLIVNDKEIWTASAGEKTATLEQALYELREIVKQQNVTINNNMNEIKILKSELCKKDNTYIWCKGIGGII